MTSFITPQRFAAIVLTGLLLSAVQAADAQDLNANDRILGLIPTKGYKAQVTRTCDKTHAYSEQCPCQTCNERCGTACRPFGPGLARMDYIFPNLVCNGRCSYSPGHGWAPPKKVAIYRHPVVYQNVWQNRATAAKQGQSYPVVGMPTDTTQLGFYYQQVPQWRPNPAMTPSIPRPSAYHNRTCSNCYSNGVYYSVDSTTEATATPQADVEAPADPTPPAPIQ